MKRLFWYPWIHETKKLITEWARWIFAALILSFLILANVGAVLFILTYLRRLIHG